MDERARMLKTLACLAVAMTFTSGLLGWMDPLGQIAPETPSVESLLVAARSVVADRGETRAEQWRGIEVVAGAARMGSGAYLTAVSDGSDYHFHIDRDGVLVRTGRWARQEFCTESPGLVRVAVAREGRGQQMSRVQWNAVRALTGALQNALGREAAALPVQIDADWAQVYDLDPNEIVQVSLPTALDRS